MSSEVEAAGAVVDAGLVGSVIDKHGHEGGHAAIGPCANCGAPLQGHYCSQCGQPAHIHRSLLHMIEEIFHGVMHFDARAWRTVPRLVFQPGKLTYEYIHGRRATYISPLAMFLFVVFVMFFVFSLSGGSQVGVGSDAAQMSKTMGELTEAQTALADARAGMEKLEAELATAKENGSGPEELAEIEERLSSARAKVRAIETATEVLTEDFGGLVAGQVPVKPPTPPGARLENGEGAVPGAESPPADGESVADAPPAEHDAEDEPGYVYEGSGKGLLEQVGEEARSGELKIHTSNKDLDKKILKKLQNPELAIYKIQNTAYKFSFLLVPISLPFMWLLFFWKRGVTLFDHCVVVLYSLSFMSLLFVFMSLLGMAPWTTPALVWAVLWLAPLAHLYVQLKGAYRLSIFSALWRTFAVGTFAIISLVLFILAIIALGFTG